MKTNIYKYPLIIGHTVIEMPTEAKMLSVQLQKNNPYLWAQVVEDAPLAKYQVLCVGTGWGFPVSGFEYIGTIQHRDPDSILDREFVWHYFIKEIEKIEKGNHD